MFGAQVNVVLKKTEALATMSRWLPSFTEASQVLYVSLEHPHIDIASETKLLSSVLIHVMTL